MQSVVNMPFYRTLFLLIANQFATSLCLPQPSQDPSQQCTQLPLIKNPRKCCDIPSVISKDNFEFCNLSDNFQKNNTNALADCSKQLCVFKTLNFIKEGDKIDRDIIQRFMDVWTEAYPDYAPITRVGKARCLAKQIPGPRELCEPNKFVSCITNVAIMMCPRWILKDDECKELKNRVDVCAKYFTQ